MKQGRHGKNTVRIGVGAGMADDRVAPAVQLLEQGELDFLVCECLAERTIAREALDRKHNPEGGYTPMLPERVRAFMPLCREQDVRMVTNMGAANPLGAGRAIQRVAAEAGVTGLTLKQSVVVENLTGASGNLATMAVVKAPPDGNTLLVASGLPSPKWLHRGKSI